jgi:hypothetical protein
MRDSLPATRPARELFRSSLGDNRTKAGSGGRACHAEALAKAGRLRSRCSDDCVSREDVVRALVTGLLPYCVWKA